MLFNRIWQPPVDASRAAAVSWLLLESGGLHDLDLSALNFGPFVLHDAKTALTFIQAIVAAGGRVADARVLLNAPQARQLAEQLPTLDRYLASLMELGLDVRHLIRLVEDEPAREALLLRSAQLGHSIEAIGRFIKQFFITDNPRLLELLLGSRLQRPEVQQEIWLHLLYAPPYGAWQRFDPGQKFLPHWLTPDSISIPRAGIRFAHGQYASAAGTAVRSDPHHQLSRETGRCGDPAGDTCLIALVG